MVALIAFLLNMVASLFKSKSRLEAENAALCHQLIVLRRKVRGRHEQRFAASRELASPRAIHAGIRAAFEGGWKTTRLYRPPRPRRRRTAPGNRRSHRTCGPAERCTKA